MDSRDLHGPDFRNSASAHCPDLAARGRRTDFCHGARRRGDAGDRIRAFDRGMAAGHRDAAAALAVRVAARVRKIPGDPAVPVAQPGHESHGIPDDLLLVMDAPAARTVYLLGVSAAVPVLSVALLDRARFASP